MESLLSVKHLEKDLEGFQLKTGIQKNYINGLTDFLFRKGSRCISFQKGCI